MCLLSGLPGGHEIAIMIDLGGTSVWHCEVASPAREGHIDDLSCMSGLPASLGRKRAELESCWAGGFRLQFVSRGPKSGAALGKGTTLRNG